MCSCTHVSPTPCSHQRVGEVQCHNRQASHHAGECHGAHELRVRGTVAHEGGDDVKDEVPAVDDSSNDQDRVRQALPGLHLGAQPALLPASRWRRGNDTGEYNVAVHRIIPRCFDTDAVPSQLGLPTQGNVSANEYRSEAMHGLTRPLAHTSATLNPSFARSLTHPHSSTAAQPLTHSLTHPTKHSIIRTHS